MGSGIAMAAAQSGYSVTLYDTNEAVLTKAKNAVTKSLDFLLEKQKISAEEKMQYLPVYCFLQK